MQERKNHYPNTGGVAVYNDQLLYRLQKLRWLTLRYGFPQLAKDTSLNRLHV